MTQVNIENLEESMVTTAKDNSQVYLILLVNSRSGSCVGDSLLRSYISEIKIKSQNNQAFYIEIFDLYEPAQRIKAFEKAQSKLLIQKTVYIVICGGDGTIQWVIDQSLKSGINLQAVVFTVLPIGTGNDFAKSIGWGDFVFQLSHQKFQEYVKQICKCKIGSFDIWQSTIECFQSGSIIEIKNGQQIQKMQKKFTKNFTNYFGVGTDAQICYIAQKLKAKTKCLKKIAYGFAGFLSFWMFCGGIRRKISQILQSTEQDVLKNNQITQDQIQPKTKQQLLQKVDIKRFDGCITFLNTTSSMDLKGVWQTPYKIDKNKIDFKQQSVNDGVIEVVSYRNEISLMLERIFHMAKKVGQGNGPFMINFKQPKIGELHSVYIHINGEPYKIINIKSIVVQQSSQFPSGKIKVLYRPTK